MKLFALFLFTLVVPAAAVVPDTPIDLVLEATTDEAVIPFGDGFFVAWESTSPTLQSTLKGQRFTKTGKPIGQPFLIDPRPQSVHNFGGTVLVPIDATRVAVFWSAQQSPIPNQAVHAAIVLPAQGKVERTTSPVTTNDLFLQAARLADGSFVVAYSQLDVFTVPTREIVRFARLSPKLDLLFAQSTVNGTGDVQDGFQNTDFTVIGRKGGSLGIMKQRDQTKRASILVQAFNSTGKAVGARYAINTTTMPKLTTFDYSAMEVKTATLTDGRIIVVWPSLEFTTFSASDKWEIRARILSPAGVPIGKDFRINRLLVGMQAAPEVTALSNGGFLVSWISSFSNGDIAYQYRAYSKAGLPVYLPRTTEKGKDPLLSSLNDTAVLADKSLVTIFRGVSFLKGEGSRSILP